MSSQYRDLPVEGSGGGVTSLNSETGAVNLVAGSNITITPAGQNITIASSGGGGTPGGSNGQIQYNNAGAFGGVNGSTTITVTTNPYTVVPTSAPVQNFLLNTGAANSIVNLPLISAHPGVTLNFVNADGSGSSSYTFVPAGGDNIQGNFSSLNTTPYAGITYTNNGIDQWWNTPSTPNPMFVGNTVDGATPNTNQVLFTQGGGSYLSVDSTFNYDPGTFILSAQHFAGDGSGLTGISATNANYLYDTAGTPKLAADGVNRILYAPDGTTPIIDWTNAVNNSALLSFNAGVVSMAGGFAYVDGTGNVRAVSFGDDATPANNLDWTGSVFHLTTQATEIIRADSSSLIMYYGGPNQISFVSGVITASGFSGDGSGLTNLVTGFSFDGNSNLFSHFSTTPSNGGTHNFIAGSNTSDPSTNFNIIIGDSAGNGNLTGTGNNVIIGQQAGFQLNSSSANVFIGQYAGHLNTIGDNNIAIGTSAGTAFTSTVGNDIFIGNQTGGSIGTSGGSNIFLGDSTGFTGSGGTQADNVAYSMALGAAAVTTASNTIVIGAQSGVAMPTDTYIAGVIHGDGSGLTNLPNATIAIGSSIGSSTGGSVLFVDPNTNTLAENNTEFFWDNANIRLGIRNNTPSVELDVTGSAKISSTLNVGSANAPTRLLSVDDVTGNSYMSFNNAGAEQMVVGSEAGVRPWLVFDPSMGGVYIISSDTSGNIQIPEALYVGASINLSSDGTAAGTQRLNISYTDPTLSMVIPPSVAGGQNFTMKAGDGTGTGTAGGEWQLLGGDGTDGSDTVVHGAKILVGAGQPDGSGASMSLYLGDTTNATPGVFTLQNFATTTGAGVGTLANVPTAGGNPTGYLTVTINGVVSYIPFWQ